MCVPIILVYISVMSTMTTDMKPIFGILCSHMNEYAAPEPRSE